MVLNFGKLSQRGVVYNAKLYGGAGAAGMVPGHVHIECPGVDRKIPYHQTPRLTLSPQITDSPPQTPGRKAEFVLPAAHRAVCQKPGQVLKNPWRKGRWPTEQHSGLHALAAGNPYFSAGRELKKVPQPDPVPNGLATTKNFQAGPLRKTSVIQSDGSRQRIGCHKKPLRNPEFQLPPGASQPHLAFGDQAGSMARFLKPIPAGIHGRRGKINF